MKYTDDHDKHCDEMRLLPYGGDGNIIVGFNSYQNEMKYRREKIKRGIHFDLPTWESLKIYNPK